MRRGTVFEGIQQEAELQALLGRGDPQDVEHGGLHLAVVDTDRTATHFVTVDHHVVGVGVSAYRVGLQLLRAQAARRGEGVVHGGQTAFAIFLEHREVDDPQRLPAVLQQAQIAAHFQTQGAHGIAHHFLGVGAEEDDVAVGCAGAGQDLAHDGVGEELGHRGLYPFDAVGRFVDLHPGQALGTIDADELGVLVDLLARELGAARYFQGCHAAFRIVGGAGEHGELDRGQQISHIHQLHRQTQVRLVGAVATHGFVEGHDREVAQIHVQDVQPQFTDHLFHDFTHLRCGHEGGLHVDLGEFRLAVGTQVFVTEALDDLVVTVEAGHHQQLLEQLGGLRQSVELALVHAARHQIVTGPFRGGFGQHRGLDVEEAVFVHEAAHEGTGLGTGLQVFGHLGATQIQVAILEAHLFAVDLVEVQRQRLGTVDDGELVGEHLDGAGGHVAVALGVGTGAHHAGDLNAELAAQFGGQGEGVRFVRIEEHLDDALAVTHVDKDEAAQIATTMDPTAQCNGLPCMGLIDLSAIDRAHGLLPSKL